MNEMREQFEEKLDLLKKSKPLVYSHDSGDSYLFAYAATLTHSTLQFLMTKCVNLSLFTTDEYIREKKIQFNHFEKSIALNCSFSHNGLLDVIQRLQNGDDKHFGVDYILLKKLAVDSILLSENAESVILELLTFLESSEPLIIYGKLLNLKRESLPEKNLNEFLSENKLRKFHYSEVMQSRFFNPRLFSQTGKMNIELLDGTFEVHSFYSEVDQFYHWAFVTGEVPLGKNKKMPMIRIESECLTGHVFGSKLCDCGNQMFTALNKIKKYGCGALIYLRQEGRGIGLEAKLEAYHLQQNEGMDTVDANLAQGLPEDARDYLVGAQILNALGIKECNLLTNNPTKIKGLEKFGIKVKSQLSHIIPPHKHNEKYLETKKVRMGHKL